MDRIALRTEDITQRFGGLVALSNVDLEVPEGMIYALIGPNGAGKTTLFNIISGIQEGFLGNVVFEDKTISGLPAHEISLMGLTRTFQDVRLFPNLSVVENVMVGCHGWVAPNYVKAIFGWRKTRQEEHRSRDIALEMLALAGLEERADDEVESLALGEQKLLEIARALAADPRLLLLDEPGAGLNDAEMVQLTELMKKIKQMGITQVVVEHNMQFVMSISDRLMVLNFGTRIAEGRPDELLEDQQVIEVYLGKEEDVV